MKGNNQAYKLWLCLLCSFLLLPLEIQAQKKGDSITGKVHKIDEVTVTARRPPAKITTGSPVQLINKEDIKNLGLQNMADAVRRFAGTNVRDYGGIGGLKTVSVRNLGAAHTAVSYDGVVVSNSQAGQIDIGRFSLDNVSSLSLAIGQDENLLQPARLYASAGVLSIETEKPVFENGKSSLSQIQIRGGAFGYIAPSIRRWQKLGEHTGLSVDASFMRADGNYPFTLENGKYITQEKRNNSDIHTWQGEANLFHTFHDESTLDVKAYYFYSERGLPGAVILYNPKAEERLWDENFFTQARYKKTFSPKWTLQAQAKFNHSWNKYEDTDVKYENGKQTDINRSGRILSVRRRALSARQRSGIIARAGWIHQYPSHQYQRQPQPGEIFLAHSPQCTLPMGTYQAIGHIGGDFHYGRSKSREYSRRPETPVAHPVRFHSAMERRTIIRPRNV